MQRTCLKRIRKSLGIGYQHRNRETRRRRSSGYLISRLRFLDKNIKIFMMLWIKLSADLAKNN
jgi:hypothetical protein